MQIPEEFGQYLLLKKLSEDLLGETFRAGKVGREGLERVVLLRVFNGRSLDGEGFAQRLGARTPVQQALRSPNIGSGVDVGRVRNYSYVAYDYISGKNLATLAAQATKARLPIPPDHALLIVERLALAVAVAYESRVEDERVLHGFVLPHLVMVSNEGETRLLGFEAAPGLREAAAAGAFGPEVTRYLAPEALTSAAVAKNDDVWSLAAILFELLTGEPLPAPPPGGYGALVDAATLAQEGGALAAPVAALLKKSLVPRAERVADVVSWHKALSKLMIDGQYSPTTFNLAFFMHNLFRDEIEREGQELQAERKLDLSERVVRAAHAPAAAAAAAFDTREQTGVRQAPVREGTGVYAYGTAAAAAAPKRSKAPLWIGLAAALLLAAGTGGWLLYARDAGGKPGPQEARNGAAPAARPKAAAAAAPTQAQIQAQINAMIEQRSKEMEDKYRAQTDEQIRALQKQLEESRRAAASAALTRDERPAPAAASAPPEPKPAVRTAAAEPEPSGSDGADTRPAAQQPAQQSAVPVPAVDRGSAPAAGNTAPAATAAVPESAPASSVPEVRVGDLVSGGAGVIPPQRLSDLRAVYPRAAERFGKTATVSVRVLVDENGKVAQAERIGNKVGFGFDEAAVDAARRMNFRPATKEGVRVKMWHTLRVDFKQP
ncbi:MAG TPA: TonB family protein [Thermoanaerobaculia bacterium]